MSNVKPGPAINASPAIPLNITGNTSPEQNALLQQFLSEAARDVVQVAAGQLDYEGVQSVLEKGDRLKSELLEALVNILKKYTVTDRYRDEEATSQRVYPPNYQVRPIEAQVTALRRAFPSLGDCLEKLSRRKLPNGAEGWFAVPRWQALAPSYNEAMEVLLAALSEQRRYSNRLLNKLDATYLHQTQRAERAWEILSEQQPGNDILVVAAQAGLLHRGRSARRARVVMQGNEFGLGAFSMGCILLTHPERLSTVDALMIDCCGDEYSLAADGHFDRVPLYDYDLGGVQFSVFYEDRARNLWGSPSAFLFQMS